MHCFAQQLSFATLGKKLLSVCFPVALESSGYFFPEWRRKIMKNQRYAGQSNYSLRFPRDKKKKVLPLI
jgi:hypothetical protein